MDPPSSPEQFTSTVIVILQNERQNRSDRRKQRLLVDSLLQNKMDTGSLLQQSPTAESGQRKDGIHIGIQVDALQGKFNQPSM